MGTRSTIAILREDGTVAQVYCHWDGYYEYNGRLLQECWSDADKLELLIAQGDLSALGRDVGEKHNFNDQATYVDGLATECTFYGRDRGEKGTQAKVYSDLATYESTAPSEEYDYLFMHGQWAVKSDHTDRRVGVNAGQAVLLNDVLTRLAKLPTTA